MQRDTPLLPPANSASRARAVRAWLTGTFAGRSLLVGVAIKLLAFLLALLFGRSRGLDALDAIGDVALVAATIALGYTIYIDVKRQLLWRVRRKLILSYIFIGVVPVLLIISFFLVSGALLFFNVSAYMVRGRIATLVDQTRFLAQTAALEMQRAQTPNEVVDTLARRQTAAAMRYPMVSYAVVPAGQACGDSAAARPSFAAHVAGPWAHMPAPSSVPDWVNCRDYASLITTPEAGPLVVRALAWPDGARNAVIVDVPIGDALRREVHDEMGITIGSGSTDGCPTTMLRHQEVRRSIPGPRTSAPTSRSRLEGSRPSTTPTGPLARPAPSRSVSGWGLVRSSRLSPGHHSIA